MRAVVCEAFGTYHDLRLRQDWLAAPLAAGQVRLRVEAASIGFATLLNIAGTHQNRSQPPFVPGTEVAGRVLELGADVEGFAVGDTVVGSVRNGALAGEAIAESAALWHRPADIDATAAVHLPTIYGTAYGGLAWRAAVRPGETVLVTGAAGATGLAGVQVGKALGAQVIALASTAEKRAFVAGQGADLVLPAEPEDLAAQVKAATGGRGAEVIYDAVGGPLFDACLRAAAPGGRLIIVGFASGSVPQIPANLLLVKNLRAIGLYWGHYLGFARTPPSPAERAETAAAMAQLFDWLRDDSIRPQTYGIYDLADFREAFAAIAERRVIGKVVLVP